MTSCSTCCGDEYCNRFNLHPRRGLSTGSPQNLFVNILYLPFTSSVAVYSSLNICMYASSFQHLPWSLGVKVVFRKRKFIILNITFWTRDQLRTYSFYENGADLKNQITIILLKIWPTNRFMKKKSYNFHFHKNDVTWPLWANGLFKRRPYYHYFGEDWTVYTLFFL